MRHSCSVNVPIAPWGSRAARNRDGVVCLSRCSLLESPIFDVSCTALGRRSLQALRRLRVSRHGQMCRCVDRSREIHAWSHVQLYAACMTSFFAALYRQQDLSTPVPQDTFCIIGLSLYLPSYVSARASLCCAVAGAGNAEVSVPIQTLSAQADRRRGAASRKT